MIASNTGHKCFDAIAANVSVPLIHIADATCDRLLADGRKLVALLGTRFTMTEPFLRSRLEARGITLAPIEAGWIGEVNRIIFEELAQGRVVRDSQRKLKTLITELAKAKVQAVVLGCTELVLAVDVRANVIPVYDTTAIHAGAAVEWMLAEEEEARAALTPRALAVLEEAACAPTSSASGVMDRTPADRPDHPEPPSASTRSRRLMQYVVRTSRTSRPASPQSARC